MPEGFSDKARKSASIARKIRVRLGEQAYQNYKRTGIIPAGLDAAPAKKSAPTQAISRPDTTAAPRSEGLGAASMFLRKLNAGDIVRDRSGQRIRVQKRIPGGLRIHDNREGARDLTFADLDQLGLQPEDRPTDGKGPAARRIGELRREAELMDIDISQLTTIKDLEIAMGKKRGELVKDALDQIDPMLASDGKNLQDFDSETPWRSAQLFREFWDNPKIVAEEKLDGVRLKLHFTKDGVRTDSRRRDTKSRRFSEKSPNFGHLLATKMPSMEGTVLDGEGMIPADHGVLPSGVEFRGSLSVSTAATNASPEVSTLIQNKFGPMQFWLFDILRHKGKDVTSLPYHERRKLLEDVIAEIHAELPPTASFLHPVKKVEGAEKIRLYEDLISKGGEGIIFKTLDHRYQESKRAKSWIKLKKFQEVDAFVSGYVPGKAGNEGMVGALELSVRINGRDIGIAAVSQLTGEQRLAFSAPDGSLKKELYGRVVTFRGQELTKHGRFRHAVLVGFRDDKNKDDIDGYEVIEELTKLGLVKPTSDLQETAF